MPGAPAAGGRSAPAAGAGADGRRPMPWLGANGLLPGRGLPGRPTGRGGGALGVADFPASAAGASGVSGASVAAAGSVAGGACAAGASGATGASGAAGAGGRLGPGLGAVRVGAGAGRLGCGGSLGLGGGCSGRLAGRGRCGLLGGWPGGGSLLRRGSGRSGGLQLVAVLLAETHLRRQLDGRARRLDELTHLFELLENELALDSELFGEFVDSGLSHVAPSGLRPDSGCFSDRYGVCKLIASYSSSAHELLLQFLSVHHGWRASEVRYVASGALVSPAPPPETRRAREKALRRTASS